MRSRSPSSSPVRSIKSPSEEPINLSPTSPDQEPAEVPITVNYGGMPSSGSPPHSAKSIKETSSPFKFNYRDSMKRYGRKSPVSHDKHSPLNRSEPSIAAETRPISPPPSVQAKIRQFNLRDRQRPISPPSRDRHTISLPKQVPISAPARPKPISIPKLESRAIDKSKTKSGVSDQKTSKSNTYDGGRFSPTSSTSTESSLSSVDSATTIKASGGVFGQAYVSSICSSDESLTESSSLLKEEEKIMSPAALCIYFDKKGFPDTLV